MGELLIQLIWGAQVLQAPPPPPPPASPVEWPCPDPTHERVGWKCVPPDADGGTEE